MDENEQLNQVMEEKSYAARSGNSRLEGATPSPGGSNSPVDFRQWQIGPNDQFRPAGSTRKCLNSGIYKFAEDQWGLYMQKIPLITDTLSPLPDTANDRVLRGMQNFWKQRDKYKEHGLIYKRGILLWGPPGSGKTATLALLSQQLVSSGGLVVVCDHPGQTSAGLQILRRIEPSRPLIVIIEDIDETISRYSEHDLLSLLDGENQIDNVVMIATTNYPEKLGARIVNRPSRFDERILVGMPSEAARRVYLEKTTMGAGAETISKWVADTEGLSIAHLRELSAAVLCLEQPYEEVLKRLQSMRQRPREQSGFNDKPVGF